MKKLLFVFIFMISNLSYSQTSLDKMIECDIKAHDSIDEKFCKSIEITQRNKCLANEYKKFAMNSCSSISFNYGKSMYFIRTQLDINVSQVVSRRITDNEFKKNLENLIDLMSVEQNLYLREYKTMVNQISDARTQRIEQFRYESNLNNAIKAIGGKFSNPKKNDLHKDFSYIVNGTVINCVQNEKLINCNY